MHRMRLTLTVLTIAALPACSGSPAVGPAATPPAQPGQTPSTPGSGTQTGGDSPAPATPAVDTPATPTAPMTTTMTPPTKDPTQPTKPADDATLAARTVDYPRALRTAALKLVGDLPTLDEMSKATTAADYAAQIDTYLADPRFARQMQVYFRNMMKMGGNLQVASVNNQMVNLDTAPTFAAELVVQDRPFTDLFTANANTCPTLDPATGTFADAACGGVNGPTVGVLTDPGMLAQFYSNMAFRRVRWVQETFICSRFPAEFSPTPVAKGAGVYVSPWDFDSISGGPQAPIDFKDTSSAICANCHTTMNHIAPLFASYDAVGILQNSIQVHTPTPMSPLSQLSDWLPEGKQQLAWRLNQPVNDMPGLGQAIAADPEMARCQVARAWNWAMSKLDIVNDQEPVPDATISGLVDAFKGNGYKLKPILRQIFTQDDFVKF